MTASVRVVAVGELPAWGAATLERMQAAIRGADGPYVCPYAGRLVQQGLLWATAVDLADVSPTELAETVAAALASGSSIAVAVGPPPLGHSLAEHQGRFWDLLELLVRHDPGPWPADAPVDATDPAWSLHLGGTPAFVLATSPHYERRASRRLTDTLTAVIQPLAVFRAMLPDRAEAARAKASIRRAAQRTDAVPSHPFLGEVEGSTQHKVRQYFLPDDNETAVDEAPLARIRAAVEERQAVRPR